MAIKTVGEFVELVEKMRKSQKLYFSSRDATEMVFAQVLEKQVDDEIRQFKMRQEEKKQPGLDL